MGLVLRFTLQVSVQDFSAPDRAALVKILQDRKALGKAAAQGALPEFQGRMREMSASNRNPYGARSTFWNRMLAGTKADGDESGGYVRMPREVALRRYGGRVRPKKAKYLAIAARAEAYGKSPRQFADLRFIVGEHGAMLIQNEQTVLVRRKGGKRKGEVKETKEVGGGVMFWLVRSATINPNEDVFPKAGAVRGAALRGVKTLVNVRTKRAAR